MWVSLPRSGRRQHRAPTGLLPRAIGLLLLVAPGCAVTPAPLPHEALQGMKAAVARGEVRVQLVFGSEADLDLFVTDPQHEEIYFGNERSRLGGVFQGDRRCGDPLPRIESVLFSPGPPGRYRVSVDFPIRCDGRVDVVPYRVIVEAEGNRWELDRMAYFGWLQHVVVEFVAGGDGEEDGGLFFPGEG